MTRSTTKEIPPDVYVLLLDYWAKRTASRWTMTTKQNPKSPLERLCAHILALRAAVELYRDELVRVNIGAATTRLEDHKAELGLLLAELWIQPRPKKTDADGDGARLIEHWLNTKVWNDIVRYAQLNLGHPAPSSWTILPLHDVGKLSAVAVALKDAEENARKVLPEMGRNDQADDKTRDHATAWLVREWRERFPTVSRGSLARWLHQLEIEPGTPEKIEERLRKAEGRRRSSATKRVLSGRGQQLTASASPGRR